MKNSDLSELISTVKAVRAEMFPQVSEDFLTAVISAEERNPEDDQQAIQEIGKALTEITGSGG